MGTRLKREGRGDKAGPEFPLPKLDVAGSSPVSRFNASANQQDKATVVVVRDP